MIEEERQRQSPFDRFMSFFRGPDKPDDKNKSPDISTLVSKVTNAVQISVNLAQNEISSYNDSPHSREDYTNAKKKYANMGALLWDKIDKWIGENNTGKETSYPDNIKKLEGIMFNFFQVNLDLINLHDKTQQPNLTDRVNPFVGIDESMFNFDCSVRQRIKELTNDVDVNETESLINILTNFRLQVDAEYRSILRKLDSSISRLKIKQLNSNGTINSIIKYMDKIMSSFNEVGDPTIKYLLTALLFDRMFLHWPYIIDPDKNYQTEADAILKALGVDTLSKEAKQEQINKLSLDIVIKKILTGELPMPEKRVLTDEELLKLEELPLTSEFANCPN